MGLPCEKFTLELSVWTSYASLNWYVFSSCNQSSIHDTMRTFVTYFFFVLLKLFLPGSIQLCVNTIERIDSLINFFFFFFTLEYSYQLLFLPSGDYDAE